MPTHEWLPQFLRDLDDLSGDQKQAFLAASRPFVEDLRLGQGFRPGLRVQRLRGRADVWELTWAPDGRATWQYGPRQYPDQPHIIWRRVGTHDGSRRS